MAVMPSASQAVCTYLAWSIHQAESASLSTQLTACRHTFRSRDAFVRPALVDEIQLGTGVQMDMMQRDEMRKDGLVLVRRFTDSLDGRTTLERATIGAQRQEDATERANQRLRLQAIYQDPDKDPRDHPIAEMDSAGLALQKVCDQLESTEKPSTWTKISFQRNSARSAANDVMTSMISRDFSDLRRQVQSLESKWQGNQGQVGRRFRSMCNKLDGFKDVFAVFPSQTMYTSVLCGSLSLIVNAAVSHSDIAELLSEAVANIADKAGHAAKLLLIYPRNLTLRRLFAGLYARVFLFYRDTIQWYLDSKVARALKSFNTGLKDRYQKAQERIDDCLDEIYRVAGVAHVAESCFKFDLLEEKIDRMRDQISDTCDQLLAGQAARRTLMAMVQSNGVEGLVGTGSVVSNIQYIEDKAEEFDHSTATLNRTGVRALSTVLKIFVVGTEGPSLFKDGHFWLPEVDISFRLGEWISPDTELSTLWLSSATPSKGFSSSRAAALVAAVAAWETGLPVISHFCDRPYPGDVPAGRTVEEVGLIGLVYSLVIQLLQFRVEKDTFRMHKERLDKLDGSDASWTDALLLLEDLLRSTPQVQRCIIDGLNELCFSDGADWCGTLLRLLFEHQKASQQAFKVLLTTNGQSRVLPEYVALEDQALVQRGVREVVRGGRWLDSNR